jgi:hypothetical protein
VRETPTGQGCTTRLYSYDEESNRTTSTTRKPTTSGGCATSGGTVLKHTYDEADHLLDTGVTYEALGNIAKLPAADAEKYGLTSTYYVDGAVATQLQNGLTDSYSLDPEGRVRETVSTKEKIVQQQFVSHYDAPGGAVAWTITSSGEWTRNIAGIDGTLVATETAGGTPVLQLHDLEGDAIATAALSSEATKLLSTYNSTEFGVPNAGQAPPKFAWLGAGDVASERSTGIITEGATSYVPLVGKPLESEQVAPPGLADGSGAGTPYTFQEEAWNMQGAAREAAEAPGLEAGREREAAEAACRANIAACPIESEDPHWNFTLTIYQAWQLSGILVGGETYSWVDIGDDIRRLLGIDYVSQVEELVEEKAVGFTKDDVTKWAYGFGVNLGGCVSDYNYGYKKPTRNAHCWVYIVTNNYHVRVPIIGTVLFEFELPNWKKEPQVKYCPKGTTWCYEI